MKFCGPLVLDAMRDSARKNSGWDLPEATSYKRQATSKI